MTCFFSVSFHSFFFLKIHEHTNISITINGYDVNDRISLRISLPPVKPLSDMCAVYCVQCTSVSCMLINNNLLMRVSSTRSTLTLYFRLNVESDVEWIYSVMCLVHRNSSFGSMESSEKE